MEKKELMGVQFSSDTLDMIARLKSLFDPECRLNPGKVLPTGRGCMEIRQPALDGRAPDVVDPQLCAVEFLLKSLSNSFEEKGTLLPSGSSMCSISHLYQGAVLVSKGGEFFRIQNDNLANSATPILFKARHLPRHTVLRRPNLNHCKRHGLQRFVRRVHRDAAQQHVRDAVAGTLDKFNAAFRANSIIVLPAVSKKVSGYQ